MHADQIKACLDRLAKTDDTIRAAVTRAGYPAGRVRPRGIATLVSAIIGQQVSVHAARAIQERVFALMQDQPSADSLLALSEDQLRGAGLSRQKYLYVVSLAETVHSGALDLHALETMSDQEAITCLTQVKGIGTWSAQMYLMFALGRQDIWPVDDLGVQEGVARMLSLDSRPKPKALSDIGNRWVPARSAVALLAWHYYARVPLET